MNLLLSELLAKRLAAGTDEEAKAADKDAMVMAVYMAARQGGAKVIREFVASGCDFRALDEGVNLLLTLAHEASDNIQPLRAKAQKLAGDTSFSASFNRGGLESDISSLSKTYTKGIAALAEAGANVNAADPDTGKTVLMHVSALGLDQAARALVDAGAAAAAKDKQGLAAADYARTSGYDGLARYLADPAAPVAKKPWYRRLF